MKEQKSWKHCDRNLHCNVAVDGQARVWDVVGATTEHLKEVTDSHKVAEQKANN